MSDNHSEKGSTTPNLGTVQSNPPTFPSKDKLATDVDTLAEAFRQFRENPVERLRVELRRFRAGQLRQLLSMPDAISLGQFNRDVWAFETSTLVDGQEWKGKLFTTTLTDQEVDQVKQALDSGRVEFHGNYVWNPGGNIFGPKLPESDAEKQQLVRSALRILANPDKTPAEKVAEIDQLRGFGLPIASGLTVLFHPNEWALCNRQSKGALQKLGLPAADEESPGGTPLAAAGRGPPAVGSRAVGGPGRGNGTPVVNVRSPLCVPSPASGTPRPGGGGPSALAC